MFPARWRQRLVFSRGLVSDDTEHAIFVAQSLIAQPRSVERFARRLARCLRWWLAQCGFMAAYLHFRFVYDCLVSSG